MKKIDAMFWSVFTIGILLFAFIGATLTIPWYTIKSPVDITHKTYFPGDSVELTMDRISLLNLGGRGTRELIRIDDLEEYEILTVSSDTDIERGMKRKILYFKLPTVQECPQLKHNSYVWQGHVKYKPFGVFTRTEHFVSEVFHIEIGDELVE